MTKLQTYEPACSRDDVRWHARLLWPILLVGSLTLTACDLGNILRTGGEGRHADAVVVPPPDAGPSAKTVRAVQKELAELGYAPGPVDGKAGPKTVSAVREYQAQAGLPVDGRVTLALLENLRSKPVQAPPNESEKTAVSLPPPDVGREVVKEDLVIDSKDDELAPLYEVGDVVAWSDGLVETVVRVGGNRVFWRGSDGSSFNADRNFILPPSSWDDAAGPGSARSSVDAKSLWPLSGLREAFEVSTSGPTGDETVREWTCRYRGKNRLTVPAGTFDTLAITCERKQVAAGEWRYRTWFYAPAVRHYVRRVDRYENGMSRAVALVAIRPGGTGWPAAARAGLDWVIQDALDNRPVGVGTEWSSTSIRDAFEVMPTGSRASDDGQTCRTFVLVRRSLNDQRSYPAIACKNGDSGSWLVPVLDDGAVPAGAVVAAKL